MPKTLHTKLLASYIMLIVCCLLLVAALSSIWLRQYERQVSLSHSRLVAQAIDRALEALPHSGTLTPTILREYIHRQVPITEEQIVLVNANGLVLEADTNTWTGAQLPIPPAQTWGLEATRLPWQAWRAADNASYYLLFLPLRYPMPSTSYLPPNLTRFVVLAVSAQDVEPAWQGWLPPLVGIALLSLILSALVSYPVVRSITKPVEAMTQAAEEIAQGQFEQTIPVESEDEIGRLATAFNRMTQEVERSQRTQRDFLVNVSHDLQTPLTSIHGFSQAMVEGAIRDEEGFKRAGNIIFEEANRMKRLISDLLDLIHLEAGQIEMAKLSVDVAALLRTCAHSIAQQAADVGIHLRLELPHNLPTITGDAERLAQAFGHLLDNALKFTPADGQVAITAYTLGSIQRAPHRALVRYDHSLLKTGNGLGISNGQWLVVTISDTGIGIAPEDQERIFERFYRADKSRSSREGVGLGLSIVQEIIAAHDGDVTVSSHCGQGSQFHVTLPIPPHAEQQKRGSS